MSIRVIFVFTLFFYSFGLGFGQAPACDVPGTAGCESTAANSIYLMNGSTAPASTLNFTFDTFGKYLAGITYVGATDLRLVVVDNGGPCKWKLRVNVDNQAWVGAVDEWEQLVVYGTGAPIPVAPVATIPTLEMRVRNECNTPQAGAGSYFSVADENSFQSVIENAVANAPGGCAGSEVNTAGSYLTNFGEYHFNIDYRVQPGFAFQPGLYQVVVRFCLTEDL